MDFSQGWSFLDGRNGCASADSSRNKRFERIKLSSLTKKLGIGLLGVSLLTTGCDTSRNIELVRTEIKGRTTVTLTQEVKRGYDSYTLTVKDSTGATIAHMRTDDKEYLGKSSTEVSVDGRIYNLRDKGYRNTGEKKP